MIELRISGYLMEVDDKVGRISKTFQVFDLKNLGSVKADITNRISIPTTNYNVTQLELIAPLSIITTKPYQNLPIQLVQDGQNIIVNGVCQIVSIGDRISIDAQGGIKSFWDSLEGLYLNDIDLSTWNGLWDNDRHDTVRNTTTGLVCPVVNTGQLVDGTTYVNGYTYGSAMIPFFYYSTIIDQIFSLVGYSKSGTIFSDTNRYSKMVMNPRFVYNDNWITKKEFTATNNGNQTISPATYTKINFTDVINNEDGLFDITNDRLTVSTSDSIEAGASVSFLRGKLFLSLQTTAIAVGVDIIRYVGGDPFSPVPVSAAIVNNTNIITIESNILDLYDGEYYDCFIEITAGGTISKSTLKFIAEKTTDLSVSLIPSSPDQYWFFNQLLPRFTLKSFIVDFMKMFGLVITEKNNIVTFKTIKEILNDIAPSSVELSRENKEETPLKNFDLSGFGQANKYYWVVQEDELVITDSYGLGKFLVVNSTLPDSKDIYTSLFTASDQITQTRINQAADIKIYDQTVPGFTKAASFGTRLLLLRNDDGVNFRFKSGTDRTDYFIGYFIDKNQAYNLDWQELLDEYYPEYIAVLNKWCTVQQEYFITLVESAQLDLTKPATKDGIKYIIEKVNNYVPDDFAKFNLIRI